MRNKASLEFINRASGPMRVPSQFYQRQQLRYGVVIKPEERQRGSMSDSIKIAIEDLFVAGGHEPTHSARLLIERAAVIVIRDRDSGQQAVLYGLDTLHRQIEKGAFDLPLMLVVEFDETSDNLAKLFGLIQTIKALGADSTETELESD
jgi:hypothetical protein